MALRQHLEDIIRLSYRDSICAFVRGESSSRLFEMVNFHYRTAVLRLVPENDPGEFDLNGDFHLDIYMGGERVVESIPVTLLWINQWGEGYLGVMFERDIAPVVDRANRSLISQTKPHLISICSPLQPNQALEFSIVDVTTKGLLLKTSLDNAFFYEGMVISTRQPLVWNSLAIKLKMAVENTRVDRSGQCFYVGVSVLNPGEDFIALANSLSKRQRPRLALKNRIVASENFPRWVTRNAPEACYSIKVGLNDEEFNRLEELREHFGECQDGYSLHRRAIHICGFIGKQLVAGVELRAGDNPETPMRFLHSEHGNIKNFDLKRSVELSCEVVDPRASSPELMVALIQTAHAWLSRDGRRNLYVPIMSSHIEEFVELGFVKVSTAPLHIKGRTHTLMVLRRSQYPERYFNPMMWGMFTSRMIDQFILRGHFEDTRTSRLLPRLLDFFDRSIQKSWQFFKKASIGETNFFHRRIKRQGFLDPKWTSQHFLAVGIYPYFLCADRSIDKEKVDEILASFNLDRAYFRDEGNWISVAFLDEFLSRFEAEGGDAAALTKAAARKFLSPEVMGIMYYVAKHFLTPKLAFKSFEVILPRFDRSKVYRLEELTESSAKVAILFRSPDHVPQHRELCYYWQESFAAYIKLLTGVEGKVVKTGCFYESDQGCTYEIDWSDSVSKGPFRRLRGLVLHGLLLGCLSYLFYPIVDLLVIFLGAVGYFCAVLIRRGTRLKKQHLELKSQFDRYQDEANFRYEELQNAKTKLDLRYREAQLLDKTSQMIQGTGDLSSILRTSMESVCDLFGFERAFVALADPRREKLQLVTVTGAKNFSDDVLKLTIPLTADKGTANVFSTVFVSGQPAIINDIGKQAHLTQGAAGELVRQLNLGRFLVVPISAQEQYGIVFADHSLSDKFIDKSDLVLLRRLTQHAALAMDKQAKLNQEENLRRLFEKYVPRGIVEMATKRKSLMLGGELRRIVCMFLDIRDFTHLSTTVAPHVSLEILNSVFQMVYDIVTPTQGIIDKFLGDGALVVWGAVGEHGAQAKVAMAAALDILSKISTVNKELEAKSLPPVRVGMGLHAGQAIVGNVGATERMEFTSIGSTVNLASRLEGLCRPLAASIVVSKVLYDELDAELKGLFVVKPEVKIRGVRQPMSIGVMADRYPVVNTLRECK